MRNAAFGSMPAPVRFLIAPIVRRSVLNSLKGQGTARMSDAENDRLCAENSRAIASLLDNKPYTCSEPGRAAPTQRCWPSPSLRRRGPFRALFATLSFKKRISLPIATGWL